MWSPEALEALLAPVALYPDPVLTQVLMASTNPQEVLDAGNWLIANPELEDKALDQAAEAAGFTPPMRGLMQFRQIVDQMCLEMGWTAELGQAFTNDQAGVLAAVQRLRQQAQDVGTLQNSEQMKVETQTEDGQEAIVIEPPSPEIVYVPTYDPVAAYAPPATTTATEPAPMAQPTAVAEEDKGHSTGTLIATGVLAFGAGILVNEIFDDDDDYYRRGGNYYPNYYGGYMPPPPPYAYRPVYGGGYRPGYNYNRPPSYNKVLSDNNVVVVNPNKNNNYWNNFDDRPTGRPRATTVQSPITKAKPNRPELAKLNAEASAPRQRVAQAAGGGAAATKDWKGQGSYAGARPEARAKANLPPASKATTQKAASNAAAAKGKVSTAAADRGYAGAPRAKEAAAARPEAASKAKQAATSRPEAARPSPAAKAAGSNRPEAAPKAKSAGVSRPADRSAGAGRATAASGSGRGAADRAASQRGKQSLPQGAKSKGAAAAKKKKR